MTYPQTAGHKGQADTGIAGAIHANKTIGRRQREAFETLKQLGSASADEVAGRLNRHWFHVRPRFSELRALGLVQDTGRRVDTGLGGKTIVFRCSTEEELALFNARKAAEAEHGGVA